MDSHAWEGQRVRRTLLERCRDPSFMLEFGPVGDLPIHLTFLLQKSTLGCAMLEAVTSSDAYWAKCEELVTTYGKEKMPLLPAPQERDTARLQEFILNIPYQHDLRWWFDEWQQREQVSGRGGVACAGSGGISCRRLAGRYSLVVLMAAMSSAELPHRTRTGHGCQQRG